MTHIQHAALSDLPQIVHLWRERLTIVAQADPRFRRHLDQIAGWQATMQARLAADGAIFVASEGVQSAIIGFIACTVQDSTGLIDAIALDAHTYHSRLGRDLFNTAATWLADTGAATIAVCVPRYHPVEQAFWRALGGTEWRDSHLETSPETLWMTL